MPLLLGFSLDSELRIAEETANIRVARHEMLPIVTLDYTYNVNGLGGSPQDSFAMTRSADFQDHAVGVRLEVPLAKSLCSSNRVL